ncbi:MAG TPA: orotate phosphoribosyltransferase, partial [Gemmatimonadaceae bacterium]|nr:orotate phosphoribosyltransferase [Gemmatimonadaceae bacterium]
AGVLIALDRMERGQGERSAVQEVRDRYGIPVIAIATLDDLMRFIRGDERLAAYAPAVAAYREQYGAS